MVTSSAHLSRPQAVFSLPGSPRRPRPPAGAERADRSPQVGLIQNHRQNTSVEFKNGGEGARKLGRVVSTLVSRNPKILQPSCNILVSGWICSAADAARINELSVPALHVSPPLTWEQQESNESALFSFSRNKQTHKPAGTRVGGGFFFAQL